MGFVDRQQIDGAPQHFERVVAQQSLGRHIEQPERAVAQAGGDAAALVGVGGGIERSGGNAERVELGDLVAHQRDQRRDDQRERMPRQRRKLIAQRLARAGRHHRQHVLAGERGGDDLLLAGAEVGEAVDRGQRAARFGEKTVGVAHWPAAGSNTGVHCTSSMRSAPQASMTSRSKPSAAPLAAGMIASAARKSSSIGKTSP